MSIICACPSSTLHRTQSTAPPAPPNLNSIGHDTTLDQHCCTRHGKHQWQRHRNGLIKEYKADHTPQTLPWLVAPWWHCFHILIITIARIEHLIVVPIRLLLCFVVSRCLFVCQQQFQLNPSPATFDASPRCLRFGLSTSVARKTGRRNCA